MLPRPLVTGAEISPKSRLGDLKPVNAEVHGVETINPGIIALGRELDAGIDPIKPTRAPATVAPDWSNTVPVTVPRLV